MMDEKILFTVLDDPESILNTPPINLFWRRYFKGMNMRDIDCYHDQHQCLSRDLTSVSNNDITTIVKKESVSQ